MTCALCDKEIGDYHASLNRLALEEGRSADLCEACIDRFLKWQQEKFAKLFPTSLAKKRYARS